MVRAALVCKPLPTTLLVLESVVLNLGDLPMLRPKLLAALAIVLALFLSLLPPRAMAHDTPDESDAEWQILCTIDHQRADDPIVHPGPPGAAHMQDRKSTRLHS